MCTSVAAILAITGGAYAVLRAQGSGADPMGVVAAEVGSSPAVKVLEQERQHMILLDAASRTMNVASSPKLAAAPAPTQTAAADGTGGTGGPAPVVDAPPPDPGTAQAIAYKLLPSFGFSASTQYGCLDDIFSRESGWRYNAENASGAYGIPQALPGSKMASAGPDWQTNPTTQIKWGIGYVKERYGSPCNAWAFWQAHGWY
jgi:hypothetical protein